MQSTVEYNKENMSMQLTQMMLTKLNASVCHAILICTHASIANAHLLGQFRICGIVQLVTHLGITAYSHSFQSTEYLNVYYKVKMYTHA